MTTPIRLRIPTWLPAGIGSRTDSRTRFGGGLVLAVGVLTVAARLAVPIPGTPVPVSLQDLAMLLVGIVLGPTQGAAAMFTYVGLGAAGAPVFSNGHGGLAWLMGPTGGYLLAYPAACYVVGAVCRQRRPWLVAVAGIFAAQAVIYAGGALQLALLTGGDLATTVGLAVTPFLPGVVLKTAFLLTFLSLWPRSEVGDEGS